jgi:hypothetical protein
MVSELVFSLIRCLAHLALDAMLAMHVVDVPLDISWPNETFVAQRLGAWVTPSTALAFSSCQCRVGEMWNAYRAMSERQYLAYRIESSDKHLGLAPVGWSGCWVTSGAIGKPAGAVQPSRMLSPRRPGAWDATPKKGL